MDGIKVAILDCIWWRTPINPSTQEAEAGEQKFQSKPWMHKDTVS